MQIVFILKSNHDIEISHALLFEKSSLSVNIRSRFNGSNKLPFVLAFARSGGAHL